MDGQRGAAGAAGPNEVQEAMVARVLHTLVDKLLDCRPTVGVRLRPETEVTCRETYIYITMVTCGGTYQCGKGAPIDCIKLFNAFSA